MRQKSGLSLSQLARRVDTSPASLSRYENGWDRFEVYTLQKIALSLGYAVSIHFEPVSVKKHSARNAQEVVDKIKRLFWDHPLTKKDFKLYLQWVVERVIEYGDLDDVRMLAGFLGRPAFLSTISLCRFQSPKTKRFWQSILEKEGMKCMKRRFRRTL